MRLSSSISLGVPSPRPRLRLPLLFVTAVMLLLSTASSTFADSATWKANASFANWNRAENWNPETIPNGPSDIAIFATSSRTVVSISANTEVNGIVFGAGANPFTITARPSLTFTISGVGFTNNSGIPQNFVTARSGRAITPGKVEFTDSATAGSLTFFTNEGGALNQPRGGITQFSGNSSGGNGTFTNKGGAHRNGGAGMTFFLNNSTAANGTFTNEAGAVAGANGGFTSFSGSSTAGNGTFTTNGPAFIAGPGHTFFSGNSTAANGTFTNNGGTAGFVAPGLTEFSDFSTAGDSIFTNNGGTVSNASGGITDFDGTSNAGNGTFINNGGTVSGAGGGRVLFCCGSPSAGDGTFISNGGAVSGARGGIMQFSDSSTAGNATLIINGGVGGGEGVLAQFFFDSTGGTARIEVFDNGALDIGVHNAPGISIGSIEGTGLVFLGALNLTVGSNNLSTNFSGVIQDGGIFGGTGGSLTKIGTGKLVLRHENTYTGGTIVNRGTLVVNNTTDSGTGAGPVFVKGGKLGGKGIIAGAVTVGTGNGSGAVLAPGYLLGASPGALTIQSPLTFNGDGIYEMQVNSGSGIADEVIANGVTIISGAEFLFADLGSGTLTLGTVFTVINNTAATPIAGRFSSLPDGSTFTSNGNSYHVNYEGGDGNDLTLTVVP